MPEQVSIADKMLAYEVTGQGPSSFSRTGSVTAGTLTVSSPRRWPRPVTGSRTSTSAVVVTPVSAGTATPTSPATWLLSCVTSVVRP
jgi:hypothetical protein